MSDPLPELTPAARERFDRNIRLAEVGEAGQRRLLAASALVIGAGGLGSPALLFLAGAGVGHLGIADSDRLEPTNLNRQVLHRAADLGRPKAESARDAILARWPECRVDVHAERVTAAGARALVRGAGVVLDCSDNFSTRLAVADACWAERVPLVTGGVLRFGGQLLSVIPAESSPCYRCLVPENPTPEAAPGAAAVGILGAVAGMMGSLQAVEAIKILLGIGETLAHHMLMYDGLAGTFRTVRRTRDPACPCCGKAGNV